MAGQGPASRTGSQRVEISACAIDLALLDRQTLGDNALRREVLKLFVEHVGAQLPRLRSAASAGERIERAHSIRSAALGIGALAVARFAREIELAPMAVAPSLTGLEAAIAAALGQIAALNGDRA